MQGHGFYFLMKRYRYLPMPQETHVVESKAPNEEEYFPAGQFEHAEALAAACKTYQPRYMFLTSGFPGQGVAQTW